MVLLQYIKCSICGEDVLSDWERIVDHGKQHIATRVEPSPTIGESVVYTALIRDIEARAEFGKAKYGQYLQTRDGRDTLVDMYQECLDLAVYFKKLLMERED